MKPFRCLRSQFTSDTVYCLGLVIVFIFSRLWLAALGVRPDINHFYNHWQYLDIDLLRHDFLASISLLHSQPPLWNGILGLLWRIAGGESERFAGVFIAFSTAISLSNTIFIYLLLRRFRLPLGGAIGAGSVYIFASSAYFYEAYIFYPLFTSFLVLGLFVSVAYGFTVVPSKLKILFYVCSCLFLLALSLTWTLFHPIFVVLTSGALLIYTFKRCSSAPDFSNCNRLLLSVIFALTIFATFANPLKNMILFGHFGSGSWVGMSLSQVAPGAPRECGFDPLTADETKASRALTPFTQSYTHPSISSLRKNDRIGKKYVNHNHIGFVYRSNYCREIAKELIAKNPQAFLKGRIRQFASSHTRLSDSYFIYPIGMKAGDPARRIANWRNVVYLPVFRGNGAVHHLGPLFIPLGIVAGGTILCLSPAFRGSLPAGCAEAMFTGLWVMCWIYIVGYGFNGGEQERMRFTIEPLFIAWMPLFGYYFVAHVRRGSPRIDGSV